jgi:hypothetical protein
MSSLEEIIILAGSGIQYIVQDKVYIQGSHIPSSSYLALHYTYLVYELPQSMFKGLMSREIGMR